ncbi:MAG TPA: dihydrofolate reductase [Casimicrobiaceae bacterium]|jgi:dihydrofolate reductase
MATESQPAFALIAAVARNGVIGIDHRLPWRLPEDLKRFRALTTGHTVIMGRRTWESLHRALPDRQNIVITRTAGYRAEGAETAPSLADALAHATCPPPVFCIGGGLLYRDALPLADAMYITEIDHSFAGDATFPPWEREQWRESVREPRRSDGPEGFDYAFVTYRRVGRSAVASGNIFR